MILSKKQIEKLKIRLALDGTGAKSKLANKLDLHSSQITLMCKTGFVPIHCEKSLHAYLLHKILK